MVPGRWVFILMFNDDKIHYVNLDTLRGSIVVINVTFLLASTNITWIVEPVTISVRLDSSSPCFYFLYSAGQESPKIRPIRAWQHHRPLHVNYFVDNKVLFDP